MLRVTPDSEDLTEWGEERVPRVATGRMTTGTTVESDEVDEPALEGT